MIIEALKDHQELIAKVISTLTLDIAKGCEMITDAVTGGKKILIAGNGGSAADAQHIAAELTGRFVKDRKAIPGIALTTDTSALTAIANDFSHDYVFSRQIDALANPGDLFIAISTSGNSPSILRAITSAQAAGCVILGLSGRDGGQMNGRCDLNIIIPSDVTARIQEMHIMIGHILCEAVDDLF